MKHFFLSLLFLTAWLALAAGDAPAPADLPWVFSTYLGSESEDQGSSLVVDAQGRPLITGYTSGTRFPASRQADSPQHGVDVFATRFDANGAATNYLFWFNALTLFAEDEGYSVALDAQGNAYVTGYTRSEDFCTVFGSVPGYHSTYYGETDAFVLKIRADGSGLDYCTFLGGADWDVGRAIVVDRLGNAYVTGGTWSTDFPTTTGAVQPALASQRDTFLVKLDAAGATLLYGTFLGGSGQEEAVALQIDSADGVTDEIVYVAGWTNSADFPVTPGVLGPTYRGSTDGFLYQLDLAANRLAFVTYLGGSGADRPAGLTLRGHQPIIAGATQSADFPTTAGALAAGARGGMDAFVAAVASDGRALSFSTYLGGSGDDWAWALDAGSDHSLYVAGATTSTDFPVSPAAVSRALGGERDAFLARLSADGATLVYSTYLGGSNVDVAHGVAAAGDGDVVLTGSTSSADFPTTPHAYDTTYNGGGDIFVTRLRLAPVPLDGRRAYLPLLRRR